MYKIKDFPSAMPAQTRKTHGGVAEAFSISTPEKLESGQQLLNIMDGTS